jgi:hypothetical protein
MTPYLPAILHAQPPPHEDIQDSAETTGNRVVRLLANPYRKCRWYDAAGRIAGLTARFKFSLADDRRMGASPDGNRTAAVFRSESVSHNSGVSQCAASDIEQMPMVCEQHDLAALGEARQCP